MSAPPRINKITFGRNASPLGIGQSRPTLSWRYDQDITTELNWTQQSVEIKFITANGQSCTHIVNSSSNIECPWPSKQPDLASRERVKVSIRAQGRSGWSPWYTEVVEAALLEQGDWSAKPIAADLVSPAHLAKRPFYTRKAFTLDSPIGQGRIYATALGVYEITLNGKTIGDHVMAPGWQSYHHRLHYQTYEVPADLLVQGENVIEAVVGEGWYSGRLTWQDQKRNIWGNETAVMIQLEVDGTAVVVSGSDWEWRYGALLASELYDGETYDVSLVQSDWRSTKTVPLPPYTALIAPEAPPIRRIEELKPIDLIVTPSAKRILDFGQNMVGWVKIRSVPKQSTANDSVVMRFAEVLDKGEMGIRPLRSAKVTDRIYLGKEALNDWEPKFTTHGFRYCEITGPTSLFEDYKDNFVAVVVHSDMERLGDFTCSHEMVNKFHQNVVWGLRGNFVGLPTDCPQRDERLGWTGDLQAFTPTASFLYDTSGFLANWLHDLSEEQLKDASGIVPLVVPNTLTTPGKKPLAQAIWGDVCVIAPKDLYHAYGSTTIFAEMWSSIVAWLDSGIPRSENGLWSNPRNGFQLADWLDPSAPPDDPGAAATDQYLVADAYLVHVASLASEIANILGKKAEAEKYREEHARTRKAFQQEYMAPSGRLSSDTQTAYCLAYQFKLFDPEHLPGAAERLIRLVTRGHFRIATGFAGTPGILHALTKAGHLQAAYRMMQEKGCPSWLYPITMGATTIWERWDSLLPDGTINPGEMTSFNHYALGAMANFLHTTVAGLRPLEPGYRMLLIQPRPGGSLTSASAHTVTPSGRAAVAWLLRDGMLRVEFEIPANTTAVVDLNGEDGKKETLGSGRYTREVVYKQPGEWPPPSYSSQFVLPSVKEDTLAL